MSYRARYFAPAELACKCGRPDCDAVTVDEALLRSLDLVRSYARIPLVVASGVRCAEHNRAVGGVPDSSHVTGRAVDIRATSSRSRYLVVQAAIMAGFTRIGIARTFVHVDNDASKPEGVAWLYG